MYKFFISFLRVIALLCYYVSFIFPRSKNKWVFGESTGFNNNSKYFFIDVLENHPEIRAYWIANKKVTEQVRQYGYPAYYKFSIKGLWLCLTSKVYVVSSTQGCVDFWTSGGATIVNLWHGVGWKACLWSNPFHSRFKKMGWFQNFHHKLYYPHLYYKPDLLLSSSPYMTKHFFAPMFEIPERKCVEDLYPRCKFMMLPKNTIISHMKKVDAIESLNLVERIKGYSKVIYYAPTFRDEQYDFIQESGIDNPKFNEFLKDHNCLFLIKCHPSTKIYREFNYSNVWMLNKYVDSYYIMPFTDILISDYSSIVFDYVLLEKKVILYPFDIDRYNKGSRSFAFKYDEITGDIPIIFNIRDLENEIAQVDNGAVNDISMIWKKGNDLYTSIINILKK